MLISTVIPGASYSSGTFSIPWSALNAILTTDGTAADSFERLLHALVTILVEKQTSGALTQPALGVEVSSIAVSQGVWETPAGTFGKRALMNTVLTFDLGTASTYLTGPDAVVNH